MPRQPDVAEYAGSAVPGMCPTARLKVLSSAPSRTIALSFSRGISSRPIISEVAARPVSAERLELRQSLGRLHFCSCCRASRPTTNALRRRRIQERWGRTRAASDRTPSLHRPDRATRRCSPIRSSPPPAGPPTGSTHSSARSRRGAGSSSGLQCTRAFMAFLSPPPSRPQEQVTGSRSHDQLSSIGSGGCHLNVTLRLAFERRERIRWCSACECPWRSARQIGTILSRSLGK